MLNENARKWVEALRSGKYKQAKYYLSDGVGMCCLGVLCDVFGKENGIGWDKYVDTENNKEGRTFMGAEAVLPRSVQEWVGLSSNDGVFSEYSSLASMNDTGKSFAKIADLIQKESEKLFLK